MSLVYNSIENSSTKKLRDNSLGGRPPCYNYRVVYLLSLERDLKLKLLSYASSVGRPLNEILTELARTHLPLDKVEVLPKWKNQLS